MTVWQETCTCGRLIDLGRHGIALFKLGRDYIRCRETGCLCVIILGTGENLGPTEIGGKEVMKLNFRGFY